MLFNRRSFFTRFHKNWVLLTTSVTISVFITGCKLTTTSVTGAPEPLFELKDQLKFVKDNYGDTQLKAYLAETDTTKKRSMRNSIVLGRMHAIDLAYGQYERELFIERQRIPFWSSTASLGLGAAASAFTDITTQTTLIALDNSIKGTRSFYERDILMNKSIEIVQTNMRAERNRVRASIIANLDESDTNYPLELALGDVERYRAAGTFATGIQSASNSAAGNLTISEGARNQAKTINTTYGTDNISAYLNRLAQSSAGMQKIDDAMRQEGISVDAGQLIFSGEYAGERRAVFERLKDEES